MPADGDSRHLADPVVLAANRVTQWKAAGAVWVRLAGQASMLQPVDGVRAREAIARITEESAGVEKISRVEIYAEGDVAAFWRHGLGRFRISQCVPYD